jgi:ferredoxin-NADP reductase
VNSGSPVTETSPAVAPAIRWQMAVVTEIREQTARIKSFFFRLPQPFAFQAGQHVDVRLTAPDGYRAMRSYSIASAPEDGATIELAIERLEDGEVSLFFHETVAVGDEIELRGPLGGYFIWPPTNDGPLFFAGGGSGVVPLMSMIRHRAAAHQSVPVLLLYSARDWDDVLFRDELIAFDGRNDGFTLVLTLTRAPARRPRDYSRRVDATMIAETLARLPAPPRFGYVCGANAFVNAAADGAVAAGIPATDIRTERYGG